MNRMEYNNISLNKSLTNGNDVLKAVLVYL